MAQWQRLVVIVLTLGASSAATLADEEPQMPPAGAEPLPQGGPQPQVETQPQPEPQQQEPGGWLPGQFSGTATITNNYDYR